MRSPLDYFTDIVLRGPTIGCMLICMTAALVGVIVFLRKESLVGEALSHAAYPGVILGVWLGGILMGDIPDAVPLTLWILLGAFTTSWIGLKAIQWLERRFRIRSDSALTLVLASFMGAGLTLASRMQFARTSLYRRAQAYLFGQAATMTDQHAYLFAILAVFTVAIVLIFFKELKLISFDSEYAKSIGVRVPLINRLAFILVVLAVVLGLRAVGVVLMSAMLVAPPVAARQHTHRLSTLLLLAGSIGLVSGFLGNYLSVELVHYEVHEQSATRITLPTGPMIVLVAATLCLGSLLFARERGILRKFVRMGRFRYRCMAENILKSIWRMGPRSVVQLEDIAQYQPVSRIYLKLLIFNLQINGWIAHLKDGTYRLTKDGRYRAQQIVRLHRLWEVYLADHLGLGVERVHRNAEEMEHILTPELEKQLTEMLRDPAKDPHQQPIPPRRSL